MFRITVTLLCTLGLALSTNAQLVCTSAQTSGNWAEYYVNEVLLGAGVTAFNINFTGDSVQIGEFTNSNTGVGMPYGLVLSNGNVEDAPGPNSSSGTTTAMDSSISDTDLFILSTDPIFDAGILEFDFVPTGDTLSFEYVFASEEYNEYVGGGVNDAFGFFLSGPGISGSFTNGAINLALIPGSGSYVTINTVNLNDNPTYYVNNDSLGGPIEYDGHTVVLTAQANVICGDTYHIKLAVGDGGDPVLDSGVFLEGGSFRSNIIEINIASVNGDSTLNEGCGAAEFLFARQDTADTSRCFIVLTGTATNGVDFTEIPDTIELLPGVFDTTIVVDAFADAIAEGMEYITISAVNVTACNDTVISSGTLFFFDLPNLVLNTTADTIFDCPTQDSVTLNCQVLSGGPPPYSYQWSNGMTGSVIDVPLADSFGIDTFIVEVQDSCALFSVFDTVILVRNYQSPPVAVILNDTLVNCAGNNLTLVAGVESGNGPFTYQWSTGSTNDSIETTVNGGEQFMLTVTDVCGRTDADTATLGVKVPTDFLINLPDSLVYCAGSELSIEPVVSGAIKPYTYDWASINPVFGPDAESEFSIVNDTVLTFWVRDDCGSQLNKNVFVDALNVPAPQASLPDLAGECSGTTFLVTPQLSGGLGPFYYAWSTGDDTTTVTVVASVSQLLSLTVTDFCQRTDTASTILFIPRYEPIGLVIPDDAQLCIGESFTAEVLAYGGDGKFDFSMSHQLTATDGEWFTQIDSNVFQFVSRQNNYHIISAVDGCGNTATDTLFVELDHCISFPNVLTPDGDGVNDGLVIPNATAFPDAHLIVYNRWGTKVFEAKPYLNDWVPVDQSEGTYFYVFKASEFPEFRGDLTLIKD